jgi:adenine-specific DNA-methyltransferase
VFASGGFDAVIGNPPYGAYLYDLDKHYLKNRFICQSYQLDTYLLFLEKSNKDLLRENGFFGMIIPNPWLTNILQTNTRKFVVENTRVVQIVHFRFPIFYRVTVDTEIIILQKADATHWKPTVNIIETLAMFQKGGTTSTNTNQIRHDQDKWRSKNGGVINIFLSEHETFLAESLSRMGVCLSELFAVNVGIKPYQVGKGKPPQTREIVDNRPFDSGTQIDKKYRACLRGSDIQKYIIFPLAPRYLKYGDWLAEPRPAANFNARIKIFMRQTGDSLIAVIDTDQYLCLNNMHVLVPRVEQTSCYYVLGLLNSRMMNWYYHSLNPEMGEALAEVKKTNVEILPIKDINFTDPTDVVCHDRMVALVESMLALHKQSAAARLPDEKERLQRQIQTTDRQIDKLVYELYGLTGEEIRIVEGKD